MVHFNHVIFTTNVCVKRALKDFSLNILSLSVFMITILTPYYGSCKSGSRPNKFKRYKLTNKLTVTSQLLVLLSLNPIMTYKFNSDDVLVPELCLSEELDNLTLPENHTLSVLSVWILTRNYVTDHGNVSLPYKMCAYFLGYILCKGSSRLDHDISLCISIFYLIALTMRFSTADDKFS